MGRCAMLGLCVIGLVGGCGESRKFECDSDEQCRADVVAGRCEQNGYCSFPSNDCPSGFQYGQGAGDLAGMCVNPDVGGTGATTTTAGGTSTTIGPGDSGSATTTPVGTGTGGGPVWWDCTWDRRNLLTVAGTGAGEMLDAVPVLVRLTADRVEYDAFAPSGVDLRFVASDGAVLKHEIEDWQPGGTSSVWLKIPTVGADPVAVEMYYGNLAVADVQDPPATWSSFAAVWHLDPSLADSTSGNADGNGVFVNTGQGVIGAGAEFGGFGQIDVDASPSTANVFESGGTLEAWIDATDWGINNGGYIINKAEMGQSGQAWEWMLRGSGNTVRLELDSGGQEGRWEGPQDSITLGTPHYLVVVADESAPAAGATMYVDGAAIATVELNPLGQPPTDDVAGDIQIGNRIGGNNGFEGVLDEIRISSVARSPAWVDVQYRSMTDQLVSFGAVEAANCP